MSELLPCPFCNTSPEANNLSTVHPINREKTFWVFNCLEEIGGCGASMIGDSKKDAIDKWNTRTLMSSQPPFAYAAPPQTQGDDVLRDAMRYRWLRHGDNDEGCVLLYGGGVNDGVAWLLRTEELDAAIDAAMK